MSISYDNYDIYVADEAAIKTEMDQVNAKYKEYITKVREWEKLFDFPCTAIAQEGTVIGLETENQVLRPYLKPIQTESRNRRYEIPKRIDRKLNVKGDPYRLAMEALPKWDGSKEILDAVGFEGCRSWINEGPYLYREKACEHNGGVYVLLPKYSTDPEAKEKLEHPAFRKLTKKEAFCALED
ncbi:MAG: hypothetical protein ACOYM3_21595 [Terrimicrobiaceae bacterium]